MRPEPIHKSEAFTRVELVVVIAVVFVLVSMILSTTQRHQKARSRISCVNNLKQIGTAYRIWNTGQTGRYPASESVVNGGWKEILTKADLGVICWTNYVLMSNELAQSPKILLCPSDERKPADSFSNLVSNTHLSYFVGVSATDEQPESLLGGDRNLGGGTKPDPDYGFSPINGKGNDVAIQTNSEAGPVCWSLKMHSQGYWAGAGNILLGDGSVQQVNTRLFRKDWLSHADPTTRWPAGHVPSSPSIRVLFP